MTDPVPAPTIAPEHVAALEFLGGLADTALDTFKPAVRKAMLAQAQAATNLIAAGLTPKPVKAEPEPTNVIPLVPALAAVAAQA